MSHHIELSDREMKQLETAILVAMESRIRGRSLRGLTFMPPLGYVFKNDRCNFK